MDPIWEYPFGELDEDPDLVGLVDGLGGEDND